jgi:hypothetical protein
LLEALELSSINTLFTNRHYILIQIIAFLVFLFLLGCSDQRENDSRLGVDADGRDQHSRTSFHNVGA